MRLVYPLILLVVCTGCAGARGMRLIGHDRPGCEQTCYPRGVIPAMQQYSPAPELQETPPLNENSKAVPAPEREQVAPELPEDVSTETEILFPQTVRRTSLRSVFDRLVTR